MLITSRDNSLLRQARSVRDGKIDHLIFIEGLRLSEEALRSELSIEAVIFSEEIARKEKAAGVIEELSRTTSRIASVSEKLLESISYTKTPQGIVVLARRPEENVDRLTSALTVNSLLVVLHQINNPVNVGAILRTAEAAGATGVIATRKTSDPFSPKSLRGAMGSAFRLPIWNGPDFAEVIDWCKSKAILSVCADASAGVLHTDIDWSQPCALVLGPESTGLTHEEVEAASQTVSIPMHGKVESLNVSVAAGVLLFEAARQREFPGRSRLTD
jgi:RNA methyltransferase, TrmH family